MVTHYKPGTPEFENIAKQITPIHRVKKISQCNTYIDADRDTSQASKKCRRESVHEHRG
jgi:hypothetical protein